MKTDDTAYRVAARPVLATALILMLPLLAMQFTDEMAWNLADFVVAGALLFGTGLAYELAARRSGDVAYRAAAGFALAAAFLLVWINLAVGIIGDEGNPANLMYLGVLAVGFVGALAARFRPLGMARAMFATALAQALVGAIAVIFRMGYPASPALELLGLTGFFAVLWVGSALLFRKAAHGGPERRAA